MTWALLAAVLVTAGPSSANRAAAAASQIVNPGAVLDVSVFAGGEKQMEFTATVSPDSILTCPMIGGVRVGGLTANEIAERLRSRLTGDYFVKPQVLVNVREYGGKVFVSGEVRSPGMYPLGQGLTAWSAVVLAGGFTDFASPGKTKVVRPGPGKAKVLKIDLGKVGKGEKDDLPLRDGDRVTVPRRLF